MTAVDSFSCGFRKVHNWYIISGRDRNTQLYSAPMQACNSVILIFQCFPVLVLLNLALNKNTMSFGVH